LISRLDIMFCVGFEGNTALVDASMKRAYGRLSAKALAEKGLFKAAVSSATYDKNDSELAEVLAVYNAKSAIKLETADQLKRMFGVLESFEDIDRVMYV
jgi:hypothetical protein